MFYMRVVALAVNVVIGLITGTRVKVVVSSLTVFFLNHRCKIWKSSFR